MKVLLINPSAEHWRVPPGTVPRWSTRMFRFSMLSSLYVAASMPMDIEVQILDEEVESLDFNTDADLVGISFMTFNAPRAYELADRFRSQLGKPVIFGGYHPTFCPEEAAEHADAVCVGEAERNVPAMIRDLRAGHLERFYRHGPADLTSLPVPDRRLIRRGAYALADAVQATRGCPHACTFCSISAFFGQQFRTRPVDQVISELESLGRFLIFMDDNLTANRDYAKELFARMIPLKKRWISQCSSLIGYEDELMKLAASSGCRGLFLGLESVSQEGLGGWNKRFNRARDYVHIIQRLHARGIGVITGIVFGHDWDTPEVFDRTLEFLRDAQVDALQATILTPFPGTPLFREMERQGRLTDHDWSHYDFGHVVFEPVRMTATQLAEGHRHVLREFYSRSAVSRRTLGALAYLSPATLARAVLPLNVSYRSRLKSAGLLRYSPILHSQCRVVGKAATCCESTSVGDHGTV
jgi:radical SAM superfamily enzyme YgiQ (UPF0313 family)